MKRVGVFSLLSAFILAVVAMGCSSGDPAVARVEGTVTYQGKPVEGADVSFWGKEASRAGIGKTDATGKYQISTFGTNDGALLGSHVVTVTKAPSTAGITAADMAAGKKPGAVTDPIPAKYTEVSKSPLKAEVKSGGPNQVDLTLED